MTAEDLGYMLRQRRYGLDVTADELGQAAGISGSTVCAIERASTTTRESTVRWIAVALAHFDDALDGQTFGDELVAAAEGDLAAESSYPGHTAKVAERRRRRADPDRALRLREVRRLDGRLKEIRARQREAARTVAHGDPELEEIAVLVETVSPKVARRLREIAGRSHLPEVSGDNP